MSDMSSFMNLLQSMTNQQPQQGWTGNTLNMGAGTTGDVPQGGNFTQESQDNVDPSTGLPFGAAPNTQAAPSGGMSSMGGMGGYTVAAPSAQAGPQGNFNTDAFAQQYGMNPSTSAPQVRSVTQNTPNSGPALQQYQNLLNAVHQTQQGVMGSYGQALGQLDNAGSSERQLLGMQNQQNLAGAQNSLMSRGLGNSTVLGSMQTGINRNYGLQLNNLAEGIAGQKAGILQNQAGAQMGLGGMLGNAILSGQNLPQYSALARQPLNPQQAAPQRQLGTSVTTGGNFGGGGGVGGTFKVGG